MELRLSGLVLFTASVLASTAGQVLYNTSAAPGPPDTTTVCEQSFLIDAVADTDGYIALNSFRNTTCGYRISAPQGYQIYFKFESLLMESRVFYACKYDYLTLYDGVDVTAPEVVTVCGGLYSLPRRTAISADNEAFVLAKADESSWASFRLRYRPIARVCGGTFATEDSSYFPSFLPGLPQQFSTSGVLSSFNGSFYDGLYPNNMDCTWILTAQEGERIGVYFHNVRFEKCGSYDYLEVFDGNDPENSTRLAKVCGHMSRGPIFTSGNELSLRMKTDASIQDRGFRAYWTAFNASLGTVFTSPAPTRYRPPLRPNCGGVLTNSSGEVISPGSPRYPNYANCQWYINAPVGQRVTVDFSIFQLESPCYFDSVKFYDGNSTSDPLIAQLCGHVQPGPLRSFSENLLVVFSSDGSVTFAGFKFEYEFIDSGSLGDIDGCGGLYTSDNGEITSVGFPGGLPEGNWHCEYEITAPPGQAVSIVFSIFDLRSSTRCASQSLTFYDGNSTSAPLIARRCGSHSSVEVRDSTGESLLVVFDSNNNTINGSRFSLAYRFIAPPTSPTYPSTSTAACGGVYYHNNGTISSPNFPNNYHNHAHCEYTITAYADHVVRVNFIAFNLESHPQCAFDSVKFYDGNSTSDPLIAELCGHVQPGPLRSFSENLLVVFSSDISVTFAGFKFEYEFVDSGSLGDIDGCGGLYTSDNGEITSVGFPGGLPEGNWHCEYEITAPPGQAVSIVFSIFDLRPSTRCASQSLTFYDGNSTSAPLIARRCGSLSSVEVRDSTGESLLVVFDSNNNTINGSRFSLAYRFIAPPASPPPPPTYPSTSTAACGGVYYHNNGTISSPNFPNNYHNHAHCEYTITAYADHVVRVNFTAFNLESHSRCAFDSVKIYDGSSTSSRLLANECGDSIPGPYTSTSENITIVFDADHSSTRTGFSLDYVFLVPSNDTDDNSTSASTTDSAPTGYTTSTSSSQGSANSTGAAPTGPAPYECGTHSQTITTSSSVVVSPNYPSSYSNRDSCLLRIQAPLGHHVVLTFTHFGVEGGTACPYDRLRIYDASTTSGNLISQLCGTSLPSPAVRKSTGRDMTLYFTTDGSVTESGWRAVVTWEVTPTRAQGATTVTPTRAQGATTECGVYSGTITYPGFVTSPNYPSRYSDNDNCQIHIVAPLGYGIVLTFSDFDVEAHQFCSYDKLYIYDSIDTTGNRLARLCGSTVPSLSVYRSTDRYMTLHFISDYSVTRSGWRAEFAWEALNTSAPTIAPVPILNCDAHSLAPTARLISPNFPNNYPSNLSCTFTILRAPGDRINLTFSDFDLESDSNCTNDYVEVYDGPSRFNPGDLVSKLCGSSIPSPINSTGRSMVIYFSTNGNNIVGSGFNATYEIF